MKYGGGEKFKSTRETTKSLGKKKKQINTVWLVKCYVVLAFRNIQGHKPKMDTGNAI